jgi:hypothetical protein
MPLKHALSHYLNEMLMSILSRQITPSISAKEEKVFWFDILFGKAHNKQINVSVYRIKLHVQNCTRAAIIWHWR